MVTRHHLWPACAGALLLAAAAAVFWLRAAWWPGLLAVICALALLLWVALRWRGRGTASTSASDRIPPIFDPVDEGDPITALYAAARSGNSARALELMAAGADPHALPPADATDQRSLLALAAVLPEPELLRALIARGVNINHAHAGMSALIAATRDSWHGRPDAVTMLLTNGANPHLADAEGNTPLHHAARSSSPTVAALLCDAGAERDARNQEGVTPLGMACACGNWRLAKFLIDHGARPDSAESAPALLSAAATDADDPAGVELLLKHKARVNSRDAKGRSALHEAALHGHVGILHTLLAARAEADPVDEEGNSPFLDAVRGGHLDAVNLLLDAGADIHRVDARGRNTLALACLADNPSLPLLQRLLDIGVRSDVTDRDGKHAIDHAVNAGHWAQVKQLDPDYPLPPSVTDADSSGGEQPPLELLRALLRKGQDISDEHATLAALLNPGQLDALLLEPEITAEPGHLRWLLAQGANPDIQDSDGKTPLQQLLERLPETLPAVAALLQHQGVKVETTALPRMLDICLRGQHTAPALEHCALALITRRPEAHTAIPGQPPPLTLAVRLGWNELTAQLLRSGADPDARDPHGLAAIHLAAALGRESSLRLLLRHGAAIDLRTQDGQTPLGIALAAGHRELADWLDWRSWPLPARALLPHDLPAAAMTGDTRAVLRLLELGLALEATDDQGCTALLRAAGGGHLELVQRLLERGANVNHSAASGATPLSAAVSMAHVDIIACLIGAGADLKQRLPGELTVLMLAAARGLPHICQQLLAAGTDIHASNAQGMTALHCAAHYGFSGSDPERLRTLLALLLAAGADSNACTAHGLTPLLLLLGAEAEPGSVGDEAVIEAGLGVLLDAGAKLDAQEHRHGFGPLHLTALHGLARIAQRLLRAGADPELADIKQRPPRAIAIACGFIDIASELTPVLNRPGVSMARFLNGRE